MALIEQQYVYAKLQGSSAERDPKQQRVGGKGAHPMQRALLCCLRPWLFDLTTKAKGQSGGDGSRLGLPAVW
jgi:hypothetical protein